MPFEVDWESGTIQQDVTKSPIFVTRTTRPRKQPQWFQDYVATAITPTQPSAEVQYALTAFVKPKFQAFC